MACDVFNIMKRLGHSIRWAYVTRSIIIENTSKQNGYLAVIGILVLKFIWSKTQICLGILESWFMGSQWDILPEKWRGFLGMIYFKQIKVEALKLALRKMADRWTEGVVLLLHGIWYSESYALSSKLRCIKTECFTKLKGLFRTNKHID